LLIDEPRLSSDSQEICNDYCTEAAGIEAVDFAAGRSLGYSTRESLARSCAAAGVGVIADARNPGAGRLRVGRSREKQGRESKPQGSNGERNLSHNKPPDVTELNVTGLRDKYCRMISR